MFDLFSMALHEFVGFLFLLLKNEKEMLELYTHQLDAISLLYFLLKLFIPIWQLGKKQISNMENMNFDVNKIYVKLLQHFASSMVSSAIRHLPF